MSTARRTRWVHLAWIVPVAAGLGTGVVLGARWLRAQPATVEFLTQYSGFAALPAGAPEGFPAWLGVLHFLNALLLLLVIKTGWQVRTGRRPEGYWTRRNTGAAHTKGAPNRIPIRQALHLSLDALWVLVGAVFVVLLLVSGHWMRLVPVGWDVIPNAISAALQYASFDWPLEQAWTSYNALQLLTYFITVFIAGPLALLSGLRLSPAWPRAWTWSERVLPLGAVVRVHLGVLAWFAVFTIAHVTLVFATGALRNLNHMYASRDDQSWIGAVVFAASLVATAGAWLVARPVFIRPILARFGTVSR